MSFTYLGSNPQGESAVFGTTSALTSTELQISEADAAVIEHREYAEALRQIADLFEAHPEIPLPEQMVSCYSLGSKEMARAIVKALGTSEKDWSVDSLIMLRKKFGPIMLRFVGQRGDVCERVQVGTKLVPAQPASPATEEYEEPVYEYRCSSLLADGGAQ
jgi:hypothetical protein